MWLLKIKGSVHWVRISRHKSVFNKINAQLIHNVSSRDNNESKEQANAHQCDDKVPVWLFKLETSKLGLNLNDVFTAPAVQHLASNIMFCVDICRSGDGAVGWLAF